MEFYAHIHMCILRILGTTSQLRQWIGGPFKYIFIEKKNQSGEEMNETEPAAANVPKVIFKYPG